ncbi:MAG: hypothetical protein NT162_01070 [Candidatus Woesebacteria bacterium]|nr:hypothetical protein [Candidatus Woesebacteria bacterium]
MGVMFLREHIKQSLALRAKKFSGIILFIVIAAYYLSFESYMVDFITKYSAETASDWQYPYKEIFVKQKSGIVTDKYAQPYIFALFYQKISPKEFRSTVKYNPVGDWGMSLVSSFNSFEFTK